jgi:hypothetical protein
MKDHTIIILLLYYNRPKIVRNALRSVKLANEHYKNWILAIHDDASDIPIEPIAKEILSEEWDKVKIHRSEITKKDKIKLGSPLGKGVNHLISTTPADIGIMLCDDDALHPLYLVNLNEYFSNNDVKSCHSNIVFYNPLVENFEDAFGRQVTNEYGANTHKGDIYTSCIVDASQVAWRISCNTEYGAWFPEFHEKNHDAAFFSQLDHKCGRTSYTGFISQYKGWHDHQLGKAPSFAYSVLNNAKLDSKVNINGSM